MIVPVAALAVAVGVGAVLLAAGLRRRPDPPAGGLDGTAGAPASGGAGVIGRVTALVSGDFDARQQLLADAAMIGRAPEAHALVKLWGLAAGGGLVALFAAFLRWGAGVNMPLGLVLAASAAAALGGFWLPDSMLKTEAERERTRFKQSSEAWLELVAQLVTSGADAHSALGLAAGYSEQPAFVAIREAMAEASARGEAPWVGLRRLADERRLRFMEPFITALELAGATGVGARRSILSQVEAARSKSLHEADAKAASAGEAMGAPLALIGGAFMVLMGYPPLAGIMSSEAASAF